MLHGSGTFFQWRYGGKIAGRGVSFSYRGWRFS